MCESTVEFHAVLPAVPTSVAVLRRFLSRTLVLNGSRADEGDAALVLSELATNAIEYGQSDRLMASVRLSPSQLTIEVTDASHNDPIPRAAAPVDAARGRGLVIVDKLATRWGCTPRDGQKIVWAEFRF